MKRTLIESVPHLEQWVEENPNHPDKEYVYSRLIACQLLRGRMCLHLQEAQLFCRSVPEAVKLKKVLDMGLKPKDNKDLNQKFEELTMAELKTILRQKNNSEFAAELGMCDKDYELYKQVRALIDEVNNFLKAEN